MYRYLREGRLASAGKFLGEWLVDVRGTEWFGGTRVKRPVPLPAAARPLFPEYDMSRLHPVGDAAVIVPRIMESGGHEAIRWLLRTYTRPWLAAWLGREGWRLGPRSAGFWGKMLHVRPSRVRPVPGSRGRRPDLPAASTVARALVYFDDAEKEEEPVLLDDRCRWPSVRRLIERETHRAFEGLFGRKRT